MTEVIKRGAKIRITEKNGWSAYLFGQVGTVTDVGLLDFNFVTVKIEKRGRSKRDQVVILNRQQFELI